MEVHNFIELQSFNCTIFQATPTNYHLVNKPDQSDAEKLCRVFCTVHFLVCILIDAVVGM